VVVYFPVDIVYFSVEPRTGRDIDFATDYGFDPGFTATHVKLYRAVHVSVVGYRKSGHLELAGHSLDEFPGFTVVVKNTAGAV
jgi:hypothetical protein